MVDFGNKKLVYIICTLVIAITASAGMIIKCKADNKVDNNNVIQESLIKSQKDNFNYNYEIPNDIDILGIISKEQVIMQYENKIEAFDLKNKQFDREIGKITDGFSVVDCKSFNDGIVWIESDMKENALNKIFIRYFRDNSYNELDTGRSNILPSISVTSKYLTYYIVNKNSLDIKIFDLNIGFIKTIASYKLDDNYENLVYVSAPNTDDHSVVWSVTKNGISSVYKYDIEKDETEELLKNSNIYNPVIKDERIFAVNMNKYFDSDINERYGSNFIVEYKNQYNSWDKFESDRIKDYVKEPQECISRLRTNMGPFLSWISTFEVKNIYDINKNEFISLIKSPTDLIADIKYVQNNVVYYEVNDYENKKSKFIYVIPE